MKDAMSHAVEAGNADMSFADDDKSIGSSHAKPIVETGNSDDKYYSSSMTQPITNDKILDERPLELSSSKLIESKETRIS